MAEVIAMAVGTAGSIAGGKVANMLTDRKAPPGGGIPGLTTSVGGKKNGSEDAIQVDPTKALDYFSQASKAHEAGYNKGLDYYKPALEKAAQLMTAGTTVANSTLKPLSTASGEALNQQLRFLGLDPIQKTAGFGDSLRTVSSVLDANPGAQKIAMDLANQMDRASALKDPADRAAARQGIMDTYNSAIGNLNNPLQAQMDALQYKKEIRGLKDYLDEISGGRTGSLKDNPFYYRIVDESNGVKIVSEMPVSQYNEPLRNATYERNKYNADIANQKTAIQAQMEANKNTVHDLNQFVYNFSNNYADNYDAAYTGAQIAEQVAQLPGYQFQYDQGAQALERKAASQGLLKSANLQLGLQEFGQQQAQSYYNQYMQNLANTVAQGTPATMQISANQNGLGNALGSLAQMYGAAQMDTARANADFLSKQLMESGNLYNNTAMFNAGAQNTAKQNQLDREAKQQQANTAAAPGYLAAQNQANSLNFARQQFAQQQAASRQGAQGYLYGSGY